MKTNTAITKVKEIIVVSKGGEKFLAIKPLIDEFYADEAKEMDFLRDLDFYNVEDCINLSGETEKSYYIPIKYAFGWIPNIKTKKGSMTIEERRERVEDWLDELKIIAFN